MLEKYIRQAGEDRTVYISDLRSTMQQEGKLPFHLHIHLYDHSEKCFPLQLIRPQQEEENALVSRYLYATIYNILSALGAVKIEVYTDLSDPFCEKLAAGLAEVFQTARKKEERTGYGKALNVNDRVLSVLFKGEIGFSFEIHDIGLESSPADENKPEAHTTGSSVFSLLPAYAEDKMLLGIDIGGTDIKFSSCVNGKLSVCKEYDWFPAGFSRAEQLIDPVCLLSRLILAGCALDAAGKGDQIVQRAFEKDASESEMTEAVEIMENALGDERKRFDAIGLSFPDVVIRNLIVGGETYKTKGMRENRELDYEKQFAKISLLCEYLKEFVRDGGAVMNTNDGPMAAFTAAVEMAAAGEDVSKGFFAHTLGTELGTGWVRPDGSIPEIPLEVYNFIIDLGCDVQGQIPSNDVRSTRNFNTDLRGTLQKYTCQSGVFRLAAKYLVDEDPELYHEVMEKGLFVRQDDALIVPTEPRDMRKPALEFFMNKASQGHPICSRIFREVGEYLAVTWEETEYILDPETKERSLFGRLVKNPACFELIQEGARARIPGLKQYAADAGMANTDLMKQLNEHPDYTVAQFAQAVGALYYGLTGIISNGTCS